MLTHIKIGKKSHILNYRYITVQNARTGKANHTPRITYPHFLKTKTLEAHICTSTVQPTHLELKEESDQL